MENDDEYRTNVFATQDVFFWRYRFSTFTDIKVGDVVSEYSYNILRTYILRTSTPEVIPDEALPPGEVIIELEPETNVVQGVRSGPGATQGEIELASNLAMGLRRINAMEEELGRSYLTGVDFRQAVSAVSFKTMFRISMKICSPSSRSFRRQISALSSVARLNRTFQMVSNSLKSLKINISNGIQTRIQPIAKPLRAR